MKVGEALYKCWNYTNIHLEWALEVAEGCVKGGFLGLIPDVLILYIWGKIKGLHIEQKMTNKKISGFNTEVLWPLFSEFHIIFRFSALFWRAIIIGVLF